MNIKIYPDFISPNGFIYSPGENLQAFCRKYNLLSSNIRNVINGRSSQHRGWRLAVEKKETKRAAVYFIEAIGTEFVKIGYSEDCQKRMDALQIGCPFELRLLYEINNVSPHLEIYLHGRFSKYRYRGEWYFLSDEIKDFINLLDNNKCQ